MNHFDSTKAYKELISRYNLRFVEILIKNGAKVYLFGGALRDMVMGKDWKDADIRVWIPLPPKERDAKIERLLAEAEIDVKSKTPFGEAFTVYRFLPKDSKSQVGIDLSIVSEQWLVGPDFTINGLYFDIETKDLIDTYGAVHDIEKGIIKTAKNPDIQFKEEPYMIFRAIKCACQFNFGIDEPTLRAMKKLVSVTEGTMKMVADKELEGFTEWFLGNMFRGLNYNPKLFEELWNDTGLTKVFINFSAQRLGVSNVSLEEGVKIFDDSKKYTYEGAINQFFSVIARMLNAHEAPLVFTKLIQLFLITAPKKYEDFLIDSSKIEYSK